ncbi:PQ-loop-domain-containing protein [Ramicandelaber brevisporus]|nr:PQ-loop-domain-containing protein [Ramicandelaber brevisporus]
MTCRRISSRELQPQQQQQQQRQQQQQQQQQQQKTHGLQLSRNGRLLLLLTALVARAAAISAAPSSASFSSSSSNGSNYETSPILSMFLPSTIGNEQLATFCGYFSLGCWIVVFSPQLYENYVRKSGESLSVDFLLLWLVGDFFSLVGAIMQGLQLTTILVTAYYIVADGLLLFQIAYYRKYNDEMATAAAIEAAGVVDPAKLSSLLAASSGHYPSHPDSARFTGIPEEDDDDDNSDIEQESERVPLISTVVQPPVIIPRARSQSVTILPPPSRSANALGTIPTTPRLATPGSGLRSRNLSNASLLSHLSRSSRAESAISVRVGAGGERPTETQGIRAIMLGLVALVAVAVLAALPLLTQDEPLGGNSFVSITSSGGGGGETEYRLIPQIFGWISAALFVGSRLPQIIKNYRESSCEGLSPLMFVFAVLGNVTFCMSILLISMEWSYVRINLPWLAGAAGTLLFDFTIFAQFFMYRHNLEGEGDIDEEDDMDDQSSSSVNDLSTSEDELSQTNVDSEEVPQARRCYVVGSAQATTSL